MHFVLVTDLLGVAHGWEHTLVIPECFRRCSGPSPRAGRAHDQAPTLTLDTVG